ncbi:MAG TPA: hypothetical protein ENI77_09520 [Nitrospirae bacterium]|nr:hypothetical protein [Nitrospirota bacterium]
MRKLIIFTFMATFGFVLTSPAFAGNDPSIKGKQREGIQREMTNFIVKSQLDGHFLHYDPVSGELKKLKLDKLHDGIVKKGNFFVSCADFTDVKGKKYDLDFMVIEKNGKHHVVQTLVHAVEGKKRPYQVEK